MHLGLRTRQRRNANVSRVLIVIIIIVVVVVTHQYRTRLQSAVDGKAQKLLSTRLPPVYDDVARVIACASRSSPSRIASHHAVPPRLGIQTSPPSRSRARRRPRTDVVVRRPPPAPLASPLSSSLSSSSSSLSSRAMARGIEPRSWVSSSSSSSSSSKSSSSSSSKSFASRRALM